MKFGYSRCSTNSDKQDINRQVRELQKAGAEDIVVEWEHGDARTKPQLNLLLERVTEGDTIFTTEVSRLARSTKQLCDVIDQVKEKRICLCILGSITVDCRNGRIDPMTNAFVQMSGVFAELELMIIRERVRSGMANAKAKGSRIGRPKVTRDDIPSEFYKYYPLYENKQINITDFARILECSRNTIYKYLSIIKTI